MSQPMRRALGPKTVLTVAGIAALVTLAVAARSAWTSASRETADGPVIRASSRVARIDERAFDGRRAFGYLERICEIGPRPAGSEALEKHRQLVEEHFRKLGAEVGRQSFQARDPISRKPVEMANILIRWNARRQPRILLGAHYDTRPFPDEETDPQKRRGRFIGANDGASGVALLMELAHSMGDLESPYGVDFVLFDGEELVYGERGEFFLGSKHFARRYRSDRQSTRYAAAVVVDMIADRDLQIYQESNSLRFAPNLVRQIWQVARDNKVEEFVPRPRYEIRDDHLPLNTIADIPACVIIDFDYPAWHTTDDTPEQCSPESLEKVGRVVLDWLRRVE